MDIKATVIFAAIIVLMMVFAPKAHANLIVELKGDRADYVLFHKVQGDPTEYMDLIRALNNAEKGTNIYIVLRDNQGGYVSIMDMISNAMHRSKATIHTRVEGYAASAAAHILMQADHVRLDHDAQILWHTGSVTFAGMRITLTPSTSFPFNFYYRKAVNGESYLHKPVYITIRGITMYHPMHRPYVPKEYWDQFLQGKDQWIKGKKVCETRLGMREQLNTKTYCMVRGIKQ